jgi:hypothetical protein
MCNVPGKVYCTPKRAKKYLLQAFVAIIIVIVSLGYGTNPSLSSFSSSSMQI